MPIGASILCPEKAKKSAPLLNLSNNPTTYEKSKNRNFDSCFFSSIFSILPFPYYALAKVEQPSTEKTQRTFLKQHLNHERGKDGNKPNLF